MKTPRLLLALFLALAGTASAQVVVGYPTFQGTAQSDLNMGGRAILNATISKDQVGLPNVENTALSTWPGSGNITSVGTITSGVWHGSQIDMAHFAWPSSIQLPFQYLLDSTGQTSVAWNVRGLYSLHLGNDGTQYNEPVLTWGSNNSWLYAWDYQPLDAYGDDGTYDNGGNLWTSQADPLLNIATGDIYGWNTYPWGNSPRYTSRTGNLLNSELYSTQNLWGDGDERYKSLNWNQRCLFDGTSQMGDVTYDDPIATQSISINWGNRTLNSGMQFNTYASWPWDPDDPQPYTGWTDTPVATWQGGLHPIAQGVGGGVPYGMNAGMTYLTLSNIGMNFVLPITAAPGAIFTIVDTKGGGFRVSQQSATSQPGRTNDVQIHMGTNATTPGTAGYITCGPWSAISLMAVDGYFYGSPYNIDPSSGYNATRTWVVISYSLGTPSFN